MKAWLERLWRRVKYEEVYLKACVGAVVSCARAGLGYSISRAGMERARSRGRLCQHQ